ncbi:2-oxo acid dehydrogenase subunit E2 [Streptomyces sp. CB02959]|uniref:2-oxo acid dehydrogenase subunit E2 n=1 Tax=Streptomyces sp. CB02959 TaxID=2020330 RepID=UPI002152A70F|nr:2-oxo acid dehydrogenase subunit E2 [Streptomyces sp. CB02959]
MTARPARRTPGTATRHPDRARRHTRYFLDWARAAAPVHLAADVDMSAVEAHRAAAREASRRYSAVSYLLFAGARTLAAHPEANAAALGTARPRLARYRAVNAKLALDRTHGGHRTVRTAVLTGADRLDLDAVQEWVVRCRDDDPATLPGAAGLRLLRRLPPPLGRLAFRAAVRAPDRRAALLGTFAVSSLGHRRVDTFHSYGGTAVTLCAGRTAPRPVVRDGRIVPAPVMRLGLTFDHRVLDGAAAAELLDDLVRRLEEWDAGPSGTPDGRPGRAGDRRAAHTGTGRSLAAGA